MEPGLTLPPSQGLCCFYKSITVSGIPPVCFVRDAPGPYPIGGIPLPLDLLESSR
jgi:hypothetical protein